jgi:hypothetical protein
MTILTNVDDFITMTKTILWRYDVNGLKLTLSHYKVEWPGYEFLDILCFEALISNDGPLLIKYYLY